MSRECCGPDEAHGDRDQSVAEPDNLRETIPPLWRDRALLLPALSGVLLVVGHVLAWLSGSELSTVVLSGSLLAGAGTFVPGVARQLVRGRLGVGLLMTIAATGAVLLGHIGEAAALAFLFSLAEALEDRAMDRAQHGLRSLLFLIPETARLSRASGEVVVPASQVRQFDVLSIRPGERVATDGVVVVGNSSIDASAVTGESIPVGVAPGDRVLAGSINGSGAIQVEATADGRENSLTTIVRLVEQAQEKKGERARLADRIARPLVPAVMIVAAAIVVFGFVVGDPGLWTERALVVLVAASPCALAIAVPVTVISAIGSASRFGVVIKSGAAFEQFGAVSAIAFDKTGTLTRNRPEVIAVQAREPYSQSRIVELAAALEAQSSHPLAAAILAKAAERPTATDVTEHAGFGLAGTVDGLSVRVGSSRWLASGPLAQQVAEMEFAGMTVVVMEVDGVSAGAIGVRDQLRQEAPEAIRQLAATGITSVMLTGDNRRTAQALALEAGIADVRAELLPSGKVAAIEELIESQPTAMIGDGINDAPALAAASVGIAMGVAGSDVAIESADVTFTGNDLRLIPLALVHARRARRIMTGNIVLSLLIIVVLFPLALFGVLGLAGVVLVHELAEVVVVLNGIRAAQRLKPS